MSSFIGLTRTSGSPTAVQIKKQRVPNWLLDWKQNDVRTWLQSIKRGPVCLQKFEDASVDGATLAQLDCEALMVDMDVHEVDAVEIMRRRDILLNLELAPALQLAKHCAD